MIDSDDALISMGAKMSQGYYELSKDYVAAYALLCDGHILVGFVDYDRYADNAELMRDVVKIVRRREFDIMVGVRGCSYGDVLPFMAKDGSELDVFTSHCKATNLEWIKAEDGQN